MMDAQALLNHLNSAQQEAVSAAPGHILVLAGAGSGKTRVLVHRIAWLIHTQQATSHSILAVTFTNKAANEMRQRIEQLLGYPIQSMWVGTFHGLAHRLLRLHWREAGLNEDFQILDSDDQQRLIKRSIQALQLDEDRWPAKQAAHYINQKKEAGIRPTQIRAYDPHEKTLARIYEAYELLCKQSHLVDFSELLLRSLELLKQNPDLLSHYQQRFRHILVDEFQDTNAIQNSWIKLFLGRENFLMMVGDDDQSIYGWRGAKIENIQRFSQEFPHSKTIRLEQNYRSTETILSAANALISNNDQRLGKNLWTEGDKGELITVYPAYNEFEEAKYIVEQIKEATRAGARHSDIAILYRSNAQSRVLEEILIQSGIAYRIYGGLRFFERAEIKDALAYLRLLLNREHDAAFERIINTPPRGIGEQTLSLIREAAKREQRSLWESMESLISKASLPSRALQALKNFHSLIEELAVKLNELALHELCAQAIHQSGLIDHYMKEKGEKGRARIENLEELVNATRQTQNTTERSHDSLSEFLAQAALESGEFQAERFEDCIQLMTLHAAKGLEFPFVFIAGVEEGLFPHPMSMEEDGRLEEERRLCYVGMTRAMKKLCLSYAETRRVHGQEHHHHPSRFLKEIPENLLNWIRTGQYRAPTPRTQYGAYRYVSPVKSTQAASLSPTPVGQFRIGQQVRHDKFGEGTIINYEGQGENTRIQIRFKHEGTKWLASAYAKLQAV